MKSAAHLQRAEALLDTCKLEAAFDADAKRDEDARNCVRWARAAACTSSRTRAADERRRL